ncbi:MAG: response regulator [bacterium]
MYRKTILLVEDNPDDIALTLRALKKNNIQNRVDVVNDGAEAISYFIDIIKTCENEMNGLPTVVLLDLKLPKVDGLEVLKFIRSNEKIRFLPVVILTSSKEEQDLIKSYTFGANSYIRKPVDFNQFMEAVQNLGLYWLLLNEIPSNRNI